jgi:hypothetical protein
MEELYHINYAGYAGKRVTGPHSDLFDTDNIWGNCTRALGSARNITGDISGINGTVTGLSGNANGVGLYMYTYIYIGDIAGAWKDAPIIEIK